VTSVERVEHCRHQSTSKTDETVVRVKELVLESRRITIHEVAYMLEYLFGSVQSILKDNLNMLWIAAKFLLPFLSKEQKKKYITLYQYL
jgi:hypothetical protein